MLKTIGKGKGKEYKENEIYYEDDEDSDYGLDDDDDFSDDGDWGRVGERWNGHAF